MTIGNYLIDSKIGAGGMGAVYLATHPGIGRKVAVKVLLPEHSKRQDLITRFFNEAKATATLRHPALIEVFDFGFLPDGAGYLIMDFLEGEALAARLARVAPLSWDMAAEIGRQLAAGVAVAHAHGIVHRDLKPDNIFLVPDPELPTGERVKILDFGIAKLLLPGGSGSKGATSTGMLIGTPLYMAPEQCRGAGLVDHRADVYSAGCILYEMLSGRPPFNYEGVGEILAAHLHQMPTPLHQIDASIPEALEAIVMTALQKDPAQRQQSMADLAAQLQHFLRTADFRVAATTLRPSGAQAVAPAPAPSWSRARSGAPVAAAGSAVRSGAPLAGSPSAPGAPRDPGAAPGSVVTAPTTFSAAASQAATPPGPALAPRGAGSRAPLVFAALAAVGVVSAAGLLWLKLRPGSPPPPIAAGPAAGAATEPSGRPAPSPPANLPPPGPAASAPPAGSAPTAPPAAAAPASGTGAGSAEGPAAPDASPSAVAAAGGAAGEGATPTPAAAGNPPALAGADAAPAASKPGAPIAKSPARASGRAHELYQQAFNYKANGEEDKALLGYRAALRTDGLSASERADAEAMAISLARKYGEIEVISGVAGATVSVDGHPRGRTPLRDPILVRAGSHVITLELAGYQKRTDTVTVAPGEKKFISLKPGR